MLPLLLRPIWISPEQDVTVVLKAHSDTCWGMNSAPCSEFFTSFVNVILVAYMTIDGINNILYFARHVLIYIKYLSFEIVRTRFYILCVTYTEQICLFDTLSYSEFFTIG